MDVQPADRDWDAFEAMVAAHKQAVARVIRVEDQLIDLMRSHRGAPPAAAAARFAAALDEARARVLETGYALFPSGAATAAATQAISGVSVTSS